MDRAKFWQLIESAKTDSQGEQTRQAEILQEQLFQLPADEIVAFDRIFDELLQESYTSELWAAGYIINGGCSDDGFYYFRGWLIVQGEQVFQNALKDPETLVSQIPMDADWVAECEEIHGVAWEAYKSKTGEEDLPPRDDVNYQFKGIEEIDWDEDNVANRYPKLAAKNEARFGLDD